jgi:hypothetical protein
MAGLYANGYSMSMGHTKVLFLDLRRKTVNAFKDIAMLSDKAARNGTRASNASILFIPYKLRPQELLSSLGPYEIDML